jgi:hypothetical protein
LAAAAAALEVELQQTLEAPEEQQLLALHF